MLKSRGFTLIEVTVVMSIIALLFALGVPSLNEYINNARLGSTAQSIFGGLTRARSEAIRLNRRVEFALTNSTIDVGITNSLVADTGGRGWVIRSRESATDPYDQDPIDSKAASQGAGVAASVTVAATQPIVEFDGLGTKTLPVNAAVVVRIENPAAGLCVPAGAVRCWQVIVGPSGHVQLCDPAAGAGDSRHCGP